MGLKSSLKPEQKCPACVCPRTVNENQLNEEDTCGTSITNYCDYKKLIPNTPDYKIAEEFCKKFVTAPSCPKIDFDPKTIRDNLLKDLNCPPPQPCSINKDIMELLDNAIETKNSDILKKIKEKVNKINLNNVNINNLQNEYIKSKKKSNSYWL